MMNKYLVKFDVWLSLYEDTLWREQCALIVSADNPEKAEEKAKQSALANVFVFSKHRFHHFGNSVSTTLATTELI